MMYFGTVDGENYGFYLSMEKDKLKVIKCEISEEEQMRLVEEANANGKIIVPDEDGKPVLSDPPAPTETETLTLERQELQSYLSATDYAVIKIAEGAATKEDYADVIEKRQAARLRINEIDEILNAE